MNSWFNCVRGSMIIWLSCVWGSFLFCFFPIVIMDLLQVIKLLPKDLLWYQLLEIILGGCSSLPEEVGEREKVVAFCKWVPMYWYESTPIQDCKYIFFILKKKTKMTTIGGFSPALDFHLKYWCSYVLLMCDVLFYYYCT